jgi:glycosyltransferase involved in cell wall biosynthesis
MRILHVIPSLEQETGGPAQIIPALCRSLWTAGVDVALCTFKRNERSVTVSAKAEPFRIQWQKPFSKSRQIPTIRYFQHLRQELGSVDLVHLNSLWNPMISLTASACRQAGVPYLVSPLGMLQHTALKRSRMLKRCYYWLLERHTLSGARAVHFFTDAEALDSRQLVTGKTVPVVIPNGVDPNLAANVTAGRFRQTYPSLQGRRILLFLGRLHPSKGLDLQLRALAVVVKHFPEVMWVLVGPDQGEWVHLSRTISTLGLQSHVLWTGQLSHRTCLEALVDADVFLLTSLHEAHSMAMNEALAVGVPVILTDTVQFDPIQEWGAGSIVPRSAEPLADAISNVLKSDLLSQKMREAGRRLAFEYLAWPKIAVRMADTYENILSMPH